MPFPTKEQLTEAVASTDRLCPGPRTLGRALHLLRQDDTGVEDISDLIGSDPALASDVLRCANSVYYNRVGGVHSLREAIQVIGFESTTRLVSLSVGHQTTNRPLWAYGISAGDYWSESLFNGLFLEALAERVGCPDAGEAYITGLLRYVGRLAVDQVLEDCDCSFPLDTTKSLSEWERDTVGATQAEVGAQLLRRWNFPERIVKALEAQDYHAIRGQEGVDLLSQCMAFSAQILPVGKSFTSIMDRAKSGIPCPDEHPFMTEHRLTVESITAVFLEAFGSYSSMLDVMR
jgi:HD-like signal output (HDOD) protein